MKRAFKLLFFVAALLWCGEACGQLPWVITTVAGDGYAGSGSGGYSGDGGAATAAHISGYGGTATDSAGNIYYADGFNRRVRKISVSGIINTIAGTGTSGFSGDGGPATAAQLGYGLEYVIIDKTGNLYISDANNYRIRKVNPGGVITTFAGIGAGTYSGDGGPATAAHIYAPTGLSIDPAGSICFTDHGAHVRKIDTAGIITRIAGNGSAGYSGDGGPATAAQLDNPVGLSFDTVGNFYVGDQGNFRVRRVSPSGVMSTFAGNGMVGYSGDGGPATAARFTNINHVTADRSGNVYIADAGNNVIRMVNPSGIVTTIAGGGSSFVDGCSATATSLSSPGWISMDRLGNLYVSDYTHYRIRKVSRDKRPVFTGGHSQALGVCMNSGANSINSLMGVHDTDGGQGETWSVVNGPVHGTLAAAYSSTSTGGILTPTGLSYTPTTGYTGTDSFRVQVTDCVNASDSTTVYVTVFSSVSSTAITGPGDVCVLSSITLNDTIPGGTWNSAATGIATIGSTSGVVTGVSAGTAVISYSVSTSCGSAVSTRTVTVNPLPASISGTLTVCEGLTTTLSDASSGGTWSSASPWVAIAGSTTGIVTGVTWGTATVNYTLPTGCRASATVTVNAVPGSLIGSGIVCIGSTAYLAVAGGGGIWSCGSTGVATVGSSSGIITGLTAGTAIITYTYPTGCINSRTITVNPLPSAITGTDSVCTSASIILSSATVGGTWSATNSYAIVGSSTGIVIGAGAGVDTIRYTLPTGCAASKSVSVRPTPPAITGSAVVCTGASTILSCAMSGGAWSSGSTSIATVGSGSGVLSGFAAGVAMITYLMPTGCASYRAVTVNLSPAPITGVPNVCEGTVTTLADATGGGTWSSGSPGIATIGSLTGVVSGIAAGTDTIIYTLSTGCRATAVVTVQTAPAAIAGTLNICTGNTTALSNTVTGGTWMSGAPAIATTGSTGVVTGITAGTATIAYTLSTGCVTTAVVTVSAMPVPITGTTGICIGAAAVLSDATSGGVWSSLAPGIASIGSGTGIVSGLSAGTAVIGYTLGATSSFAGCTAVVTVTVSVPPSAITGVATVCVGAATTLYDGTPGGTWTSGSTGIASVDPGTGIVTGIATGTATINYTMPTGCVVYTTVTVDLSPAAITGSPMMCVGLTTALADATTGGYWSSSATTTADVDAGTGVVTGMALGTATITYTLLSSGCYATATVTVNPVPTAITGAGSVCAGSSTLLSVTPGGGVWTSGATGTATVNATTGVVTGVAAGVATITYRMGAGCEVTYPVTVIPLPAVITGTLTVCPGMSTMLSDATTGGSWSSGSPLTATITSGGVVSGAAPGTTLISYTAGGCTRTATVTVNPLPAPITGAGSVCLGNTTPLSTTTTGGVWTSSSTATATVGSTGIVSGVAAGTAIISYTLPTGCYSTKNITVNALPTTIIGASSLCVGASATYVSGPAGGTWSRSNTNVNIGSGTGMVTGVTAGTTIITYTLPTGCYSTRLITINTSPGTITGTLTMCPAGTSALSVSAGSGGIWTSGATGTATINSTTGVVTGVAAGTAPITYSVGSGCMAFATVTVNPLPGLFTVGGGGSYCTGGAGLHVGLSGSAAGVNYQLNVGGSPTGPAIPGTGGSLDFGLQTMAGVYTVVATGTSGCTRTMTGSATIAINPLPTPIGGPSAVCVGATITETESVSGVWSSASTGIATIGSATGIVTGIAIGTTTVTYTLPTGCATTKTITVSTSPTAIAGAGSVCAGAATLLTDVVSGGVWISSSMAIGSVGSLTGVVTGITPGTTTITYSLGTGCTVTRTMTVIAVPMPIAGPLRVCATMFILLTDATPGGTWTSASTAVATISSTGMVSGVGAGTSVISYTSSTTGCAATAVVTVDPLPGAIGGPPTVCAGGSVLLTETTGGGVWSSGSTGVATVGSTGIVTGAGAGIATISYTLPTGCYSIRPVTVHAAPVISGASGLCVSTTTALSITPAGSGVWSSGSTGIATVGSTGIVSGIAAGTAPITFTPPTGCIATKSVTVNTSPSPIGGTATVCETGSTTLTNSAGGGIWTSGSTSIATIGSLTGVVAGVSAGTSLITYSLGTGCTTTRMVTVNPVPFAITGPSAVCVGATIALTDPTPGGTWTSGTTTVAAIGTTTGTVSGIAIGTTAISYTLPTGCAAVKIVTVTPLPSAITGTTQVCIGATTALSNPVSGGVWTSSNSVIAAIGSASGIVTGGSVGTATITYSLGTGCTVTAVVTVNSLPPGITGPTTVCVDGSMTLADVATGGTWSSGNTLTATVNPTSGTVTGVAGGSVMISYTMPTGCATTYSITVNGVPPITGLTNMCAWGDTLTVHDANPAGSYSSTSVTITNLGGGHGRITANAPGGASVTYTLSTGCHLTVAFTVNPLPAGITGTVHACVGSTTGLHDATSGGVWSSTVPGIATIGSLTGLTTGITTGTTHIIYTLPTGCKTDTTLHVDPPPAPITVMSGTLAVGVTIPFGDGTPGGVWSSALPGIASVGATTGMVTGVTAGTTVISYTLGTGCAAVRAVRVIGLPGVGSR